MRSSLTPMSSLAPSQLIVPVANHPSLGAKASQWVFTLTERLEHHVENHPPKRFGGFIKALIHHTTNFDHSDFKFINKLKLVVTSRGALFFLVIPMSLIPRFVQAFRREDTRFKWTELGDILRRDIPTVTALLYAYGPFLSWATRKAGNKQGITLQDPLSGAIYQSSDTHRLYTLQQHGDVERILKPLEGSTRGLVTESALKRHYQIALTTLEHWIGNKAKAINDNPALAKAKATLQQLKSALKPLSESSGLDKTALTTLDRSLVDGIQSLEKHLAPWADEAPKLRNVLAHAADATRTPVSVVSFLLVCGLIGVAPDVFNKLWNQRRFARLKQEHLQGQGEAVLARLQSSTQRLKPFFG